MTQPTRAKPLMMALVWCAAAIGRAAPDDAADRAENAANRAEAAAARSEEAAKRVEAAAARLERLVEKLEQSDRPKGDGHAQ
jgi:uncharacterized protein (DUF3084 family)